MGYLRFAFYNGAMSTEQCGRLREAFAHARAQRHTRVIVLLGGDDYFSNGIHLNEIEAAEDPAQESWRNLQAIDDLVKDIVQTDSHLVVSALAGDAAAGGVPLALAADYVLAREDTVLNPYYQHMGGLYGSEYWTYLLPRRIGPATTARLTGAPFRPVGSREAVRIGLLDAAFGTNLEDFRTGTARFAERVAHDGLHQATPPGQATPTRDRRAGQTTRGIPPGGAGTLPPMLLRSRPRLPPRAKEFRLQAPHARDRHARNQPVSRADTQSAVVFGPDCPSSRCQTGHGMRPPLPVLGHGARAAGLRLTS